MVIINYVLPIQDEFQVQEANKRGKEFFGDDFTPYKTTEEHFEVLIDKIAKGVNKVGTDGGWYIGDAIKVRVELEYELENK